MKTKCCSEVTDRRSASRTRADRVATESAPGHFHVEKVVEVLLAGAARLGVAPGDPDTQAFAVRRLQGILKAPPLPQAM